MARTAGLESRMMSTKEVVDHHLSSFGAGDLEGVLSDYASDAVLFIPGGPKKGTAEIKRVFEELIAEFGKPGASFAVQELSVEGHYAYLLWSADTADNRYELATDTFVIQDGKIVAQSFAAKITARKQW